MPYTAEISARNPALLGLLIDRSASMVEAVADDPTLAKQTAVAATVTEAIYDTICRCLDGDVVHEAVDIVALGYGGSDAGAFEGPAVESLFTGELGGANPVSLGALANSPARIDEVRINGIPRRRPAWVEPRAVGARAQCAAIDQMGRIVYRWVEDHPTSFPPIVINVTDGFAADEREGADAVTWSRRLRGLATDDGRTLLFNIDLSPAVDTPIMLPSDANQIPAQDVVAGKLWNMSSRLPPRLRDVVARRYRVGDAPRGMLAHGGSRLLNDFVSLITPGQLVTGVR